MENLKASGHSDQEPTQCSGCDAFPDDILMLACSHDLCLNCAALIYTNEHPQSQENFITCTICGDITNLDHSSVYELEKIAISLRLDGNNSDSQQKVQQSQNQQLKEENLSSLQQSFGKNSIHSKILHDTQQKQDIQFSQRNKSNQRSIHSQNRQESHNTSEIKQQPSPFNINNNQNSHNVSVNNYTQNQQQITKIIKGFCPEHDEEEISYFCFDCITNCICSECVIHGIHKNHNVKTIKKSYPIINEKLNEISAQIDLKQGEIQQKKSNFDYQKSEISDQNTLLKQQIQSLFQNLYRKLEQKEKQILDTCQSVFQENTEQINLQIQQLNQKLDDLHKTQQYIIDNTTQNNQSMITNNKFNTSTISDNSFLNNFNNQEVNVLNFYSQNISSLQDIIKRDVYENKLLTQQLTSNQLNLKEIELHMIDIEVEINKITVSFKNEQKDNNDNTNINNINNFNNNNSYIRQRSQNNSVFSNSEMNNSSNSNIINKKQQIHQQYKQRFQNDFLDQNEQLIKQQQQLQKINQQQNEQLKQKLLQDQEYQQQQQQLNKYRFLNNNENTLNKFKAFQLHQQENQLEQQEQNSKNSNSNEAPPTFNTQKRYSFLTSKLKEQYEQKINDSVSKLQKSQQIQNQNSSYTHSQSVQKENMGGQTEEPFNNLLNKFQYYNNKINNRSINTSNLK